jgi:hypothetical protein
MRKRDTADLLRREEALILAWISEVTREKQARMLEIRRRLRRIARARREKRAVAKSAQRADNETVAWK